MVAASSKLQNIVDLRFLASFRNRNYAGVGKDTARPSIDPPVRIGHVAFGEARAIRIP
jgi:hypothetical protein